MFDIFFKKKPSYDLSWLRVDMHSHLLPGIDDGCPDTNQSIQCMEGLQRLGFDTLYMTPHIFPGVHPNNAQTIQNAFSELREALPVEMAGEMQLATAAEFMITPEFDPATPFASNCLLPDAKILIEMSYLAPSPNIDQMIYELQLNGYQPILAHPERYPYYFKDPDRYKNIKDQGCLLQCNLLSFAGYYGKTIKKTALKLAEQGLVDYLGTDMHHERHLQALEKFSTRTDTRRIFRNCPLANHSLN